MHFGRTWKLRAPLLEDHSCVTSSVKFATEQLHRTQSSKLLIESIGGVADHSHRLEFKLSDVWVFR